MTTIPIDNIINELDLEVIYCGENQNIDIVTSDVNRLGLQFAGFFDYFASERIQVLGKVEMTYLETMDPEVRQQQLEKFFQYDFPCLVITRNMEIPEYILELSKKYNRPLLRSSISTSNLTQKLINYLSSALAPKITRHGVLVDVYGVGVFIMGESGIGKSETALELIKRGHRLVADDAVEIKKVTDKIGRAHV